MVKVRGVVFMVFVSTCLAMLGACSGRDAPPRPDQGGTDAGRTAVDSDQPDVGVEPEMGIGDLEDADSGIDADAGRMPGDMGLFDIGSDMTLCEQGASTDSDSDGVCDEMDICIGADSSGDADGDGWCDAVDNCPMHANCDQADRNADGVGDLCDVDEDGDGVGVGDNCPHTINPNQEDFDNDSRGDACDNCPEAANITQFDLDANGVGDVCDTDVCANATSCPDCLPEICNGLDDDCDTALDEGCDAQCAPLPEICNGRDDDCDAVIDEGCNCGGT